MLPRRTTVTRISDAVAAELEKRILEGSLRPGDRLPAERELAVEMGVSRPSLREAIQKLVSKDLLTTRHGGGTFVTDRLEAPFVGPWQEMLEGHPMLQSDLLEFRRMLEAQAASLAAERATDADIERLDAAVAALDAVYASNDLTACIDTDVAFHQAIAEAAHNVFIGHLTSSLLRVIHSYISRNLEHLYARPQRWGQLQAQHHAIWQAIRERKPEAAASAARKHIDFVRQSMADTAKEEERRHSALRRLGDSAS
ncbi:MAG: FCD domain-containing protein [Gammaproteobacteria bacterium]|nr:FCD domain-containing protein [Gammaproteobacteria bacterium]MBU1414343.1 FCD domain-containing protein [Gammaproteobacteria bacterium]